MHIINLNLTKPVVRLWHSLHTVVFDITSACCLEWMQLPRYSKTPHQRYYLTFQTSETCQMTSSSLMTQAEHISLQATPKRLEERGAKLNKWNCKFSVHELIFSGHVFSAEGIKADPKKIDTIVNCEAPKNVNEIRSFLGMAQYVARFIPDFASRTEPLRRLTRNDVQWKWTQQEQETFDIKEALTSTQVMAYFNPA